MNADGVFDYHVDPAVDRTSYGWMEMVTTSIPLFYYVAAPPAYFLQFVTESVLKSRIVTELASAVEITHDAYEYDAEGTEIPSEDRQIFKQDFAFSNGRKAANRLVKAGITDGLCDDSGNPTDACFALYERYSKGGYGMIISPATTVDRSSIVSSFGNTPVLDFYSNRAAFKELAAKMKAHGSLAVVQLTHPGPIVTPNQEPVAPSAFVTRSPHNIYSMPCKELNSKEINEILYKFVDSAKIAEECGFDGIQVVAANGYLGSLFLSKNINKRTDQWQGDAFVIELMRRLLHARRSPQFLIGIKINSSDLQEGGLTQEESLVTIRKLSALKVDFIEIGGGTYQNIDTRYSVNELKGTHSYKREAFFIDFAEKITRDPSIDVPFITVGGWRDVKSMCTHLKANPNMLIGLGRATCIDPLLGFAIANTNLVRIPSWFELYRPDWIKKLAESPDRETRRGAFGLENLWYVIAVASLAAGHARPRIKNLLANPLNALAFKIFYMIKGTVAQKWKRPFFKMHPVYCAYQFSTSGLREIKVRVEAGSEETQAII